ncbi:uncharacterized protein TRUGW13939_04181 [Talaromyces rugulosus]|uniref:Rap-GAP domain-containing protein n=1 Tax=Talaromyces rugulosus TaxID=121627 RepID=A0A7H8QW63_TALRU|nr:uncharacterized protein TRUGW13939_04181 [Talaromyces rugulosus]QKX57073.1 hypothetical protein TRUGW13939_04181 [Talaromyces rugulosus]
MSSGNDNNPPPKSTSSSFADVFKTLASGRRKSLSPLSASDSGNDWATYHIDGRKDSRATFGFDAMHRASLTPNPPEPSSPPDYETALRNLQHPVLATEEAETVTRFLNRFTAEQSIALWEAGSHLLYQEESEYGRMRASRLLEAVSERQDLLPAFKVQICTSILPQTVRDAIPARINALIALSDNGRKLDSFQVNILPTLAACLYPTFQAVADLRSKARKNKTPQSNGLDDETPLDNLFDFILNIFTLRHIPTDEKDIEILLEELLRVCRKTALTRDLKNALAIFDAIICCADVPEKSFVPLLEVLCSIHASVKSLSGPTSRVIRSITKSPHRSSMIDTLYSFLEEVPDDYGRNLNVVRGAIEILADLLGAFDRQEPWELSFPRLVNSCQSIVLRKNERLYADVVELCASMLSGDFVLECMQEQDWSRLADLLIDCCDYSDDTVADNFQTSVTSPTRMVPQGDRIISSASHLTLSTEHIWEQLTLEQKDELSRFLKTIHNHLSPSQARLLISHLRVRRACYPGQVDWESQATWLVEAFLQKSGKASDVRVLAIEALEEALLEETNLSKFEEIGIIRILLQNFADEIDTIYLASLVSVMTEIGVEANDKCFHIIVDTLSSPMTADLNEDDAIASAGNLQSRRGSATGLEPSLSNICMIGLVRLFLRFLNSNPRRATLLFETLIFITKTWKKRSPDALLTVFNLLFKLRCDSSGAVFIATESENHFLVAVLSRTLDVGIKQTTNPDASTSDRSSVATDDGLPTNVGRLSLREQSAPKTLSRISSSHLRTAKWSPPSWTHIGSKSLPDEPPTAPSPLVNVHKKPDDENDGAIVLKVNIYLETIIDLLQKRDIHWDLYSYILAHLGPQLGNRNFFSNAVPQVQMLRNILCGQIKGEAFREPPAATGIKKADVAICIFDSLAMLIGYHEYFAKSEQDELVRAFMLGIGSWDGTSRGCIHALSVCCHEIPLSVTKSLNAILDKMSKVITMSHVAVHILEFLALLARLPDVYVNLREEEIRTVFGICIRFIQTSREQQHKVESPVSRTGSIGTRLSGGLRELASTQADSAEPNWQEGVSQYVYTLTYHVLVFWFLSLKLQDRAKHVNWITNRLIFTDENERGVVEEQSEVFIDLMQRSTYSDLGDTIPFETFPPSAEDGPVTSKSWIVGMSILTIETAGTSGLSQIIKRMASGTTYAEYRQRTAPVLPHQVPATPDTLSLSNVPNRAAILPSHVLLQMMTTAFPTPGVIQPIPLPDDAMTRRAISSFDRNDIVDGHKIGIVFIDKDQTSEAEILANTSGSPDYENFLAGLGTKVSIRNAQFNTQGLYSDLDGEFTYAWRDRVAEIVYHVATMMPTNLEQDPACVSKKRHIGNDFVNIIFNRSNKPFNFETIPSQFNSINIVISPVSQIAKHAFEKDVDAVADYNKSFYMVRVMTKPGLPELSPASTPKIISGKSLAAYVRILGMNASVFSRVWNKEGGEHISSWRNRLREIKRLRERVLSPPSQPSDTTEAGFLGYRRNTRANIFSEEETSSRPSVRTDSTADWNSAAGGNVFKALDFTQWTR